MRSCPVFGPSNSGYSKDLIVPCSLVNNSGYNYLNPPPVNYRFHAHGFADEARGPRGESGQWHQPQLRI